MKIKRFFSQGMFFKKIVFYNRSQALEAFSLIELLVVIAIIAILASLLLPALSKAKQVSKTLMCSNNMKQLSLAIFSYANDSDALLPPGDDYESSAKYCNSWDDYLGFGGYDGRSMTLPERKQPFRDEKQVAKMYYCPSASTPWKRIESSGKKCFTRSYYANAGTEQDARKNDNGPGRLSGVMGRYVEGSGRVGWSINIDQIHDPTGTLLLAERDRDAKLGAPYAITSIQQMDLDIIKLHGPLLSNYSFCDGHVGLLKFPLTKLIHNMWSRKAGD